jgi:hypothetical protein
MVNASVSKVRFDLARTEGRQSPLATRQSLRSQRLGLSRREEDVLVRRETLVF